jgi:hypothetical protein
MCARYFSGQASIENTEILFDRQTLDPASDLSRYATRASYL